MRRDFIVPVSKERRELVGNVILYFSTLSAAFRLKAPLPPYLPPAEKSRQELVGFSLLSVLSDNLPFCYLGECDKKFGRGEDPKCAGFASIVILRVCPYDERCRT